MKRNFLPKALDKDASARICLDVQSGEFSSDMHWHDCFEIIHVAEGSATLIFDGVPFALFSGDSFFIPSERIHRFICEGAGALRVVIGIGESFIFGDRGDVARSYAPSFPEGCEDKLLFRGESFPEIVNAMFSLSSISDTGKFSSRLEAEAEIMRIYSVMYRAWENEGLVSEYGGENSTVREIEDYIKENLSNRLTAEECARHFNISYSYMAKLMAKHSSRSFSELLCAHRVEQAKKLLISTDKSITEVGAECGFSDTSYFISVFKRLTGITPKEYRFGTI